MDWQKHWEDWAARKHAADQGGPDIHLPLILIAVVAVAVAIVFIEAR